MMVVEEGNRRRRRRRRRNRRGGVKEEVVVDGMGKHALFCCGEGIILVARDKVSTHHSI